MCGKFLFTTICLFVSMLSYGQSNWDKFLKVSPKNDSVRVELIIESISKKVANKTKGDIYAWEDVLMSMRSNFRDVKQLSAKCPKCHNSLYAIWFASPAWTWEEMCGTAGVMKICTVCPKQIEYESSVQN